MQIGLLKNALQKAGLPLYLAPYGVLPTAYECGIIEVQRLMTSGFLAQSYTSWWSVQVSLLPLPERSLLES